MKMTFLVLFIICTFKDPKLAEKWTNLAGNPKQSWTPRSSWSSFFPSLVSISTRSLGSWHSNFSQCQCIIGIIPLEKIHYFVSICSRDSDGCQWKHIDNVFQEKFFQKWLACNLSKLWAFWWEKAWNWLAHGWEPCSHVPMQLSPWLCSGLQKKINLKS